MKILLTHELFPPDVTGGGERLALKLAEYMKSRQNFVRVVTSGDPAIKSYNDIETVRIPINRYLMNIFSFPSIWKYSKEADIIQTSSGNMTFPSYLVAKLQKRKICCWVHHIFGDYWKDLRGPVIGRLFKYYEKFILTRKFDYYIFQNESSKQIGLKMGIPEDKIKIITPGIDHEKFSKGKKSRFSKKVLFVGNFSMDDVAVKNKGIKYLIEAAELLPDVEFSILGNFDNIIEHPSNVKILEPVKHEKMPNVYKEHHIFVNSSLNEGFGLAILEAMSSGLAIVSTIDIGQAGKIIKPKDSKSITDAIKFYLDNPKIAKSDGNKNSKIAEKYTWDKFYKKFDRLYKDLNKK